MPEEISDSQTPKLGTQPVHASEAQPQVNEVAAAIAMLDEVAELAKSRLASLADVRNPQLNDVRSTLDFVAGHVGVESRRLKASLK